MLPNLNKQFVCENGHKAVLLPPTFFDPHHCTHTKHIAEAKYSLWLFFTATLSKMSLLSPATLSPDHCPRFSRQRSSRLHHQRLQGLGELRSPPSHIFIQTCFPLWD